MSASAPWLRDQQGVRYFPATKTFVSPSGQSQSQTQPQQQHSGALQTPRSSASQLVGSDTASVKPDPPSDHPSPSEEKKYTTRPRHESSSSGGSVSRTQALQYASSHGQPPIQAGGGQATWQGTVVSTSSYPGHGSVSQHAQTTQPGYQPTRYEHPVNPLTRPISGFVSGATPVAGPSTQGTSRQIHREIQGTSGEFEKLDPRYKRRQHDFFKRFRVFKMHWAQPADGSGGSNVTDTREPLPRKYERYLPQNVVRDKQFGQYIFSKIRWFIVVKEGADKCICVPIVTYQGKGVKQDKAKDEHAIVFTTRDPPKPGPDERPKRDEKPMRTPIRVQTDERGDKLAEMSRIDYGRVYTVEHNIKAMAFGWIHENSRKDFHFDFINVFMGDGSHEAWINQQQRVEPADDSDRADDPESEEEDDDDSDDSDEDDDDGGDDDRSADRRRRRPSQPPPPPAAPSRSRGGLGKKSSR